MLRRIPLMLLAVALSGCAEQTVRIQPPLSRNMIGRDGLGHDRNRLQSPLARGQPVLASHTADSEREKVLATLRPYSAAWWIVHDAIEADREKELTKKLAICRGCSLRSSEEDRTGSVRSH